MMELRPVGVGGVLAVLGNAIRSVREETITLSIQ